MTISKKQGWIIGYTVLALVVIIRLKGSFQLDYVN